MRRLLTRATRASARAWGCWRRRQRARCVGTALARSVCLLDAAPQTAAHPQGAGVAAHAPRPEQQQEDEAPLPPPPLPEEPPGATLALLQHVPPHIRRVLIQAAMDTSPPLVVRTVHAREVYANCTVSVSTDNLAAGPQARRQRILHRCGAHTRFTCHPLLRRRLRRSPAR